jgi:hypothetical protein
MATTQTTRENLPNPIPQFCFFLFAVLAVTQPAHSQRPAMAPAQPAQFQLENLKAAAPNSINDNDPNMCPASGSSDPDETSIGGLSSRAVYTFSSQPHIRWVLRLSRKRQHPEIPCERINNG